MTNWGSANMSEGRKNTGGKSNQKNEKYLSLQTPAVGENAEFSVRFIGDLHKFFTHWTADKKRKLCLKTAAIKANNGESLYKKQNPDGSFSDYTVEDINKCPFCQRGDDPRPRYAANVIDMKEMQELAAQSKPPIVRLMEFPVTVYQSIEYFMDKHKVIPSDLAQGPVFIIRLKYPKRAGLTKQDIQYEVDWTNPGTAPISAQDWEVLNAKLHNLINEYNPYRPGVQNVFGDTNQQGMNSNPQVFSPATTMNFNDSGANNTGFGPSITGNSFNMPQQSQPQPQVQAQSQPEVQQQSQPQPQQSQFSFGVNTQQDQPQSQVSPQSQENTQYSPPLAQQNSGVNNEQSLLNELSGIMSNLQSK